MTNHYLCWMVAHSEECQSQAQKDEAKELQVCRERSWERTSHEPPRDRGKRPAIESSCDWGKKRAKEPKEKLKRKASEDIRPSVFQRLNPREEKKKDQGSCSKLKKD